MTEPDEYVRWYVPADDRDRWANRHGDGAPPLHLVSYVDAYGDRILRLCEDETGLLVGPKDRRLPRLGIFSFHARGCSYRPEACQAGDFRPGSRLTLVREPENPFDPHAVGVAGKGSTDVAGYVNRQKARSLAKLLDSGVKIVAVSVDGTGAGEPCGGFTVVAAVPHVLGYLLGPRPFGAPAPKGQDAYGPS